MSSFSWQHTFILNWDNKSRKWKYGHTPNLKLKHMKKLLVSSDNTSTIKYITISKVWIETAH